ncbi:MAG: cytochrome P450, partial [Alphaproteobacteria bacterium]|nr:cytochrome P450 [Alphaproteobacteria bacterium]
MDDTAAVDAVSSTGSLPPGPGGIGLGRLRHRLRDGVGFYDRMYREYGDIVCFRILSQRFCVVYDPDMIGEVLVTKAASFGKGLLYKRTGIVTNPTSITSDGDEHRRIRKLLQPSFAARALAGYSEVMIQEALQFQEG